MPAATDTEELLNIVAAARRHLQRRERAGIRVLPRENPRAQTNAAPPEADHLPESEGEVVLESLPPAQAANLEQLREAIGDCRRCKLSSGRTHLVFGIGNPNADLMFVGEG